MRPSLTFCLIIAVLALPLSPTLAAPQRETGFTPIKPIPKIKPIVDLEPAKPFTPAKPWTPPKPWSPPKPAKPF